MSNWWDPFWVTNPGSSAAGMNMLPEAMRAMTRFMNAQAEEIELRNATAKKFAAARENAEKAK